jgi:AcrR family transcriptional regulator
LDSRAPELKAAATRGGRRTNAERSAATRAKLIEAAVQSLHKFGYAATTTILVAKRAKVSRGAMLHHFPNKIDLVLAAAKYAADYQRSSHRRKLRDIAAGRDRFLAITEVSWETAREPSAVALLEIMIASRSDKALRTRFAPLAAELEQSTREAVWDCAKETGIKDRATIDAMVHLHTAAMRGLSIQDIFASNGSNSDPAFKLLKWYKSRLTEHLLKQQQN